MVTRGNGSKKRVRTGIAISATELCAADIRLRDAASRTWRVPLEPPPAENGHWPSLAVAFAELARTLGVTQGTLAISLLPPFTEARRLELPPLRDDEMQRVLARTAPRYFVSAKSPQIVGASLAGKRSRGTPTPVIAAAAPMRLVAAIRHAAQQSGWTIEIVAPAESAWADAALAMWPSFARQSAYVLVAHDDRADLMRLDEGRLMDVRRFRGAAVDAAMIADTIGPSARVGVFGVPSRARQLSAALSAHGVSASPATGEWASIAERPEDVAAHFSGSEVGPQLRSEDSVALERARLNTVTWRVFATAAALFVLAAGIELWGVHRQLRLVREERARIRPQIASTMVGRTTVDAAYRHLTALAGVERVAPRWSAVIGTLSDAIPEDAFLLSIRTRDDSVVVDGLAERARRVFDALEKADGLVGVKAAAPVRRELQEGGTEALEHFAIAARVNPPSAKPAKTTLPASSQKARGPGQ